MRPILDRQFRSVLDSAPDGVLGRMRLLHRLRQRAYSHLLEEARRSCLGTTENIAHPDYVTVCMVRRCARKQAPRALHFPCVRARRWWDARRDHFPRVRWELLITIVGRCRWAKARVGIAGTKSLAARAESCISCSRESVEEMHGCGCVRILSGRTGARVQNWRWGLGPVSRAAEAGWVGSGLPPPRGARPSPRSWVPRRDAGRRRADALSLAINSPRCPTCPSPRKRLQELPPLCTPRIRTLKSAS